MHPAQVAKNPPSLLVEMLDRSGCRERAAPLSLSQVWLGAIRLSRNSLVKNRAKVTRIGQWKTEVECPERPLTAYVLLQKPKHRNGSPASFMMQVTEIASSVRTASVPATVPWESSPYSPLTSGA